VGAALVLLLDQAEGVVDLVRRWRVGLVEVVALGVLVALAAAGGSIRRAPGGLRLAVGTVGRGGGADDGCDGRDGYSSSIPMT
jgi:hypothetical protein